MEVKAFDYQRQLTTIRKEILVGLNLVLDSGKLILGDNLLKLEKDFSKYIGCGYGIGVNSGTDALKIALMAVGVKAGDEVITVSNTAVPTVSAIREIGAVPVLVEIKTDYTIDENLIEAAITRKTKLILPVHLYGKVCHMEGIRKIAKKHKLKIIEDCAQAHGSKYKGKMAGSFGVVSCFSFYPTKNLGAYGDAGMILTSSQRIAQRCRRLRMYGMKKNYYAQEDGFNSRLDELQAVILNIKLKYLDHQNQLRREVAKKYLKEIVNNKIILPEVGKIEDHCFHQFVIRVKNRSKFLDYLKKTKVGFGIHYPTPIHLQKAYLDLGYSKTDLPLTVKYAKEIVSLPIFPELTLKEVRYVIDCLNAFKG